jgi:TonB-linked SusC/RagA family outer membrane protein
MNNKMNNQEIGYAGCKLPHPQSSFFNFRLKKYLLLFVVLFAATSAFAQGRRISGKVYSKLDGPIMMANVVEKDANNRNISYAVTDINGNFTMTIKNPKNMLVATYVGYAAFSEVIGSRTHFNIELKEKNMIKGVEIVSKQRVRSNGLAIPERELSVATQTLNMDEMAGLSFESADEALQGKIAGLDITMNSGNLGAGTSMRLRGVSTINGNAQPLIVKDGYIFDLPSDATNITFDSSTEDLEEQFSTLLSINVEDIKEIKVLKDAAATAFWGSRGANGVIEITTRRGTRGKTKVEFSYRFTGSWQPDGYNMLNGDGYTMMMKEAYFNPRQSSAASNIVELNYDKSRPLYYYNFNKNTDWVNAVEQFGQRHNYYVTLSGGGEKANFRVSGGYDHETGTIIKQSLDRYSTVMVLDYDVSDRIRFGSNFALTFSDNKRNNGSILGIAYGEMPNMTIDEYDQYGNKTGYYYNMLPTWGSPGTTPDGYSSYYLSDRKSKGNAVAIANLAWNKMKDYRITPQFELRYKLLGKSDDQTQLDYKGEVYMDIYNHSTTSYYPSSLSTNPWSAGVNSSDDNEYKSLNFTTRHSLTFMPAFKNQKHAFMAMIRGEVNSGNSSTQYLATNGLPTGISDPTAESYLTSLSSTTGKWHGLNGLATVHYAYDGKYIFDVTLRADGRTEFGKDNKWGFFPGFSFRYNMSDEKFMKWSEKWLSMLAFRGGWGTNGLAPSGNFLQYNTYANYGKYNGKGSIYPSNLRLADLKWEKSREYNLGANIGFFKDLISFDINVYNKRSSNLLMSGVGIPSSSGYTSLSYHNVGAISNKGWELYANTGRFMKYGKFSMTLSANMSQNINTLDEMDATVLASKNPDFDYTNENYLKRIQIGNAIGSIYGFRYKGVYRYDYEHNGYTTTSANTYGENTAAYQESIGKNATCPIARDANGNIITDAKGNPLPMYYNYGGKNYQFTGGDVIYEDINHDGQIDALDIVYLGNSNPKFIGGFGVNFYYGQWSLKTQFNFRVGSKVVNMARMTKEDMRSNANQCASVNYRWRKNGDITEIPRAMNSSIMETYNALASDRYVESGDFTRFQYLQVGYNFDTRKIKQWGLSTLRFSLSAQNLFLWTKYSGIEPEKSPGTWGVAMDSDTTPRSKSFTASINIGF